MATPHNQLDLDSPPLTPSVSDMSDIGSLSDSEWFEITSSSHGSSESDSENESEANLSIPIRRASPDGLRLSLEDDADWQPLADGQQSIATASQHAEGAVPDVETVAAPETSLVQAVSEAFQLPPQELDASDADVAHNDTGLQLEFPDPLSSSSDDMLDASIASNSTWTQSQMREPAVVPAEADTADLHIVILGHRPSLLRTQRVVNMLVEAIGDALGAHHLVHHNHALARDPPGYEAPLFGTHEIVHGDQQTYRIVATDGDNKVHLGSHRTLAVVFFSSTRITRSIPALTAFPAGTKFLPLLPSNNSASPPPSLRARSRISSEESYSFPSSVESSIVIDSPDTSTLSSSLHAKRVNFEWLAVSAHIPNEDVLDLWPRPGNVTEDAQTVMPTALLERRAAMLGMREGLFSTAPEHEARATVREPLKEQKHHGLALLREHYSWTAIALVSMLFAILSSQFLAMRNVSVESSARNMSFVASSSASSTTTVAPPMPSAATGVPAQPASPAPVQDNSLLPSSIRNFALSVFGGDDGVKDVGNVVNQPASEAGPSGARPIEREPAAMVVTSTSYSKHKSDKHDSTSGSRGGDAQTKSPAASAEPEGTAAPLTLDPPSTKARFLLGGSRASTSTGTSQSTTQPPPPSTDLIKRLSSSLALYYPRELRELLTATDDLLAAVRRRLADAHASAAVQTVAEFAVKRHNRARRNARRIAERIGPKRAREGLRRVVDWSKTVRTKVAERRERRWADRLKKGTGTEGSGRVDWEALRTEKKTPRKTARRGTGKGSKLLRGMLGRDRGA
ncbi:hypothetical protein EXIGLDRAFT_697788 [Exidia glandulosa HHB12029]|uniref:Uncharacterized protein n=1 Tax=Exidia glandulosa HHB12029 TaxID=1314781 RepID=A0A165EKU6_EXIGL|nr:hypothetical protein EXIGLDRAFT_697788 [Exidia glandulosa HHB12029]